MESVLASYSVQGKAQGGLLLAIRQLEQQVRASCFARCGWMDGPAVSKFAATDRLLPQLADIRGLEFEDGDADGGGREGQLLIVSNR
jgi:hypothetical protein